MNAAPLLALLLAGPGSGNAFDGCKPFVQGPLELDPHAGSATWTFGNLGMLFGAVTLTPGACVSQMPRCRLGVYTDASLPPGWTAYLNLGTFYPVFQPQPIPAGVTAWPLTVHCGKSTAVQVYIFNGPVGLLTTSLVAMEQVMVGCGECQGPS